MKTLHPAVHGGILARRDLPEHLAALDQHGIDLIDVVRLLILGASFTIQALPLCLDIARPLEEKARECLCLLTTKPATGLHPHHAQQQDYLYSMLVAQQYLRCSHRTT